jgi:hypothetical protein
VYPLGAARTRIVSEAPTRLDPGNLRDLSKGYFAATFLRGRESVRRFLEARAAFKMNSAMCALIPGVAWSTGILAITSSKAARIVWISSGKRRRTALSKPECLMA